MLISVIEIFLNLERLNLKNNQLTSIPKNIGSMSSLETLGLDNNQLINIPESIGSMGSLEILTLESNQLSALPDSIGNLSSLLDLYLDNNQLTSLPSTIENLFNLLNIFLGGNLLPTYFETTLNALGIAGGNVSGAIQDALLIKNIPLPYSIKSEKDLDNINYLSILGLLSARTLSDSHQYVLEDENNQPVNLDDYIQNGIVIKKGIVTAQIRAIGIGIFPNNSENAITTERIQLNFETTFYNLSFDLNGGTGTVPESQSLIEGTVGKRLTIQQEKAMFLKDGIQQ